MPILNTDNVGDGGSLELNNIKTIATGSVGGNTLVFVGGDDDGISVFELNDDGTLTSLFNIDDDSSLELNNLRELQFVEVGGNPFLIAAGRDDGLSTFSVASNGTLTLASEIEDDGSLLLDDVDAMTTLVVGGNTFVVVGNEDSSSDEGISIFSIDSSGNLVETDQITEASDSSNLELSNVKAIAAGESGGNSYVIAGGDDDGLSVFSVDSAGNLVNVFNIDDGSSPDLPGESLELNNIRDIETVNIGGTTYVYAGGHDDGISVFTLNSNGSLTHVHDYEDGGALQINNLKSIEAATGPGGGQFIFVVGDDDELQVFSVGNDGSLTLNESFEDDGTVYLNNAEDVAFANINGQMMAIAGGDEDGISAFHVPCFTPGTMIATPQGKRDVAELVAGDLVLTADHGPQPLRLVARRHVDPQRLADNPHLAPVLFRRNTFGEGLPARDMKVSPQHRMLLKGATSTLLFGMNEVLTSAKSLIDGQAVFVAPTTEVTYIHLVFDRHEIVFAENAPTESYFPGAEALSALDAATRAELFELFPELRNLDLGRFTPARPLLRPFEARLLKGQAA